MEHALLDQKINTGRSLELKEKYQKFLTLKPIFIGGACYAHYEDLFPNCSMIHVIRDPRAAYASVKTRKRFERQMGIGKPFFPGRHEKKVIETYLSKELSEYAYL